MYRHSSAKDRVRSVRGAVGYVFAVVEHQKNLPASEKVDKRFEGVSRRADPERLSDRFKNSRTVGHGAQVNKIGIREGLDVVSHQYRKSRLPCAAAADDRHEASVTEEVL
jgi:hypothetical protein